MIDLATRGLLGHAQVHAKGFQAEPTLSLVVKDPRAVRATVERAHPGAVTLARVTGAGLAASESRSAGVMILGVEPAREAAHSALLQIAVGRTLKDEPAREVVIGAKLARRLKVEPGGELILLSEAVDGSIANDVYKVVGLSTGGGTAETGGNAVFLHLADAQDFFGLGASVHQVVIGLPKGGNPKRVAAALRTALDPSLEALAWQEMAPEAELGIEADRQGTYAMDVIVFLLVVLGMFNTMTMSTYERMFELGVMAALGTRPRRVLSLILLESALLGVIALALGVAVAIAVLAVIPAIDMGSAWGESDFAGVALPSVLQIELAPLALGMAAMTVGVTCLVGGLYPAWRAARLQPVDAMRART
jgi:ABC-type lipoprotein release transport system permease subunit